MTATNDTVKTVLGEVPADRLGVVAPHESLLSVFPGAQFAHDITIDRVAVFEALSAKLRDFREAGGGTIVDATGQFHGRDPKLLETLSRSTGVHIVASTGQGPEELLGGYFLTPQTNPPTPWPADKWSDLFGKEIRDGMVVPRVERRGPAGLIATAVTRSGATATDLELLKGAARAAVATGAPVSFVAGNDAVTELEVLLGEGLEADRIAVRGLDQVGTAAAAESVAERGAFVAIDHVGTEGEHLGVDYLSDADRVSWVVKLLAAGHCDRILLSSSATGASFGHQPTAVSYTHVLTVLVPALRSTGVGEDDIQRILVRNPAALLSLH